MFGVFKKEETPFVLTDEKKIGRIEEESEATGCVKISFGSFQPTEWVVKSTTIITSDSIVKRLTTKEAAKELHKILKKK
jgi:hypothetical protein